MCGIAFITRNDGLPVDRAALERMTDGMAHRGPDNRGFLIRGAVGLGHRRLNIIDLATGNQPMSNEDGTIWVSYNGEIYGFKELRATLEKTGHAFKTTSDTEVIVHAYEQWGEAFLDRLDGMFAFALVDFGKNIALLARDRLGIKPLVYYKGEGGFYAASELSALLLALPVRPAIDIKGLAQYLYWSYIPSPFTIWHGVKKLPPAHCLTLNLASGDISQRRYWSIPAKRAPVRTAEEWEDELDGALRASVRRHLVSDVQFGAFLSGGIDSSLVAGYMAEELEEPVRTFSVGFDDQTFSELPYAKEVAEAIGAKHYECVVSPAVESLLPVLARHYGEPFGDPSAIPTYHVSRIAGDHVRMALSGDGGDELFAGYDNYETVVSLIRRSRGFNFSSGRNIFRWWSKKAIRRLSDAIHPEQPAREAAKLFVELSKTFQEDELVALFRPEHKCHAASWCGNQRETQACRGDTPFLTQLQELDVNTYLPDDVLTKVDIAAMANSLEVRVPLLDHRVVELAFQMPPELKIKPCGRGANPTFERKHILRTLIRRRYSGDIADRTKAGFGIPLGRWLRGPLSRMLQDRFAGNSPIYQFLEPERVKTLTASRTDDDYNKGMRIWALLMLDEWMRAQGME